MGFLSANDSTKNTVSKNYRIVLSLSKSSSSPSPRKIHRHSSLNAMPCILYACHFSNHYAKEKKYYV